MKKTEIKTAMEMVELESAKADLTEEDPSENEAQALVAKHTTSRFDALMRAAQKRAVGPQRKDLTEKEPKMSTAKQNESPRGNDRGGRNQDDSRGN